MSLPVRVRFAPSPTGYLHVGGARTALFNWLYARHTGGKLVLRIEDTDKARNTEEATQAIYDGLRWLGLDWDEGPQAGGDFGPYFQSEREAVYRKYFEKLQAAGRVYEDGGSWRFKFERKMVVMEDEICGRIEIDMSNPATNPDMTIRRPDGGWIFHFVNVVDDIEMRISHVIRGEDHLSNTPKHIQLYEAFGVVPPKFAHLPLILNKDGSKMSKRDQGASVDAYIEGGFLPEAVRNFLCLLGWSPKDNREKLPIEEVIRIFDLGKINRKGATFDLEKCKWLNGEYVKELSDDRFLEMGKIALKREGVPFEGFSEFYIKAALETCKGKFKVFGELPAYCRFYFDEKFEFNIEGVTKHFVQENRKFLEAVRNTFAAVEEFKSKDLEDALKATALELGVKVGVLVHPTRLAVTGNNAGPSLYHLLEALGKSEVLALIDGALKLPAFNVSNDDALTANILAIQPKSSFFEFHLPNVDFGVADLFTDITGKKPTEPGYRVIRDRIEFDINNVKWILRKLVNWKGQLLPADDAIYRASATGSFTDKMPFSKHCVLQVDKESISESDAQNVADDICWLLELPLGQKVTWNQYGVREYGLTFQFHQARAVFVPNEPSYSPPIGNQGDGAIRKYLEAAFPIYKKDPIWWRITFDWLTLAFENHVIHSAGLICSMLLERLTWFLLKKPQFVKAINEDPSGTLRAQIDINNITEWGSDFSYREKVRMAFAYLNLNFPEEEIFANRDSLVHLGELASGDLRGAKYYGQIIDTVLRPILKMLDYKGRYFAIGLGQGEV